MWRVSNKFPSLEKNGDSWIVALAAGVWAKEASSPFLKKRTKKLLLPRLHAGRAGPAGTRVGSITTRFCAGGRSKSFLLLFFKKEGLAYLPLRPPTLCCMCQPACSSPKARADRALGAPDTPHTPSRSLARGGLLEGHGSTPHCRDRVLGYRFGRHAAGSPASPSVRARLAPPFPIGPPGRAPHPFAGPSFTGDKQTRDAGAPELPTT